MTLPHHSLVAWQRADDLFIDLHRVSLTFPAFERFELASQLRRSGFSVPVNIVEGVGRRRPTEQLRFLEISSSSLGEAGYCLHAAHRLQYIDKETRTRLELDVRKTSAALRGLIASIGGKDYWRRR